MSSLDADIDRLYQGPLNEFTAGRNALAKRAGTEASTIRALAKPTVAAWAINQLYWRNRDVYDRLIERADDLRATHNATIKGTRTDLRGASRAHEEAIDQALKAVVTLLAEHGQPATDATKQAIATTLRSLPGDEPPGRLSRPLEPRGFDMLAGAASAGRVRPAPTPKAPPEKTGAARQDNAARRAAAARSAAAREAAAAAARAVRDAEHVVRREEFEAARAVREAEKAERAVAEAEEAVEQAKHALAEAKRSAAAAARARDAAAARAAKASAHLEDAQGKEQRARAALDDYEH